MATITKITLNGQHEGNFGPDCTETDAEGYRAWIRAELERDFPGVEIDINETDAARALIVETDADEQTSEGYHVHQASVVEVGEYLAAAWDKCPWDWVAA